MRLQDEHSALPGMEADSGLIRSFSCMSTSIILNPQPRPTFMSMELLHQRPRIAVCVQNVFELRARGLIKGGTVGAALIAYGHGWYEPDLLHFEADEPARHKIIDLTVRAFFLCCDI